MSGPADEAQDPGRVVEAAKAYGAGTVVVDSYSATAAYLGALRTAGVRVVFIDDLAREALPAHVVINGGAQAAGLPYRSSSGDTLFLLGPTYALLGSGYQTISPRHLAPEVEQVLVTVGGHDALGVMPAIVDAVDRAPGRFRLCVIAGPFGQAGTLEGSGVRRSGRDISIVHAPSSLRDLMLAADVAVSAAGQTLYELAATGTPTIACELADNQSGQLTAFAEAGVVVHAGRPDNPQFGDRLTALLGDLVSGFEQRMKLSQAGQRMVDGFGAGRAAHAVLRSA
jgi:spore coat polysaccharide biosynthesis predicted glycosyltransferase SpsG